MSLKVKTAEKKSKVFKLVMRPAIHRRKKRRR